MVTRPANIQQYEYLHGSVLSALIRSESDTTLRLIETDADASRAVYRINDHVLHVKGSLSPKKQQRDKSSNWQFTFQPYEIDQVFGEKRHLVLVCAHRDIKSKDNAWRPLIKCDEVAKYLDASADGQQTIVVKAVPKARKLRITGEYDEHLVTARDLLTWEL